LAVAACLVFEIVWLAIFFSRRISRVFLSSENPDFCGIIYFFLLSMCSRASRTSMLHWCSHFLPTNQASKKNSGDAFASFGSRILQSAIQTWAVREPFGPRQAQHSLCCHLHQPVASLPCFPAIAADRTERGTLLSTTANDNRHLLHNKDNNTSAAMSTVKAQSYVPTTEELNDSIASFLKEVRHHSENCSTARGCNPW